MSLILFLNKGHSLCSRQNKKKIKILFVFFLLFFWVQLLNHQYCIFFLWSCLRSVCLFITKHRFVIMNWVNHWINAILNVVTCSVHLIWIFFWECCNIDIINGLLDVCHCLFQDAEETMLSIFISCCNLGKTIRKQSCLYSIFLDMTNYSHIYFQGFCYFMFIAYSCYNENFNNICPKAYSFIGKVFNFFFLLFSHRVKWYAWFYCWNNVMGMRTSFIVFQIKF